VLLGRLYEEPEDELLLREVLRTVELLRELLPAAVPRLTDEEPVLRRMTASFAPERLLPDVRTALDELEPVRPVTTRTDDVRSPLPEREEAAVDPVREAVDAPRLDAVLC
jgi:hypothetical protein